MSTFATTKTPDAAPPVPAPAPQPAAPAATGGFSLDGFLALTAPESRTVSAAGGYVYLQASDGTITITAGPKNVGKSYPPGDPVNVAITTQIGAFPTAGAPAAPAPAAPSTPVAPAAPGLAPSLDSILAGIGMTLDRAGQAISGGVQSIVDGVTGLFGSEPTAPATPTDATPAPAPTPTTPAPAPASSGTPEFLSQRDNTFNKDGVSADNMCTVTSLAMQLVALCGGADAVKSKTASLIVDHGGAPTAGTALASAQVEDLLMTFFDALAAKNYWAAFAKSTDAPFYGNWMNDVPSGTKFHQAGACQAHVLSLFYGLTSSNLSRANEGCATIQEFLQGKVATELASGGTFSMSTKLTGGHFVALVEVMADGIVIQDPFGAKTTAGHLRNGTKDAGPLAAVAELTVRFRENPTLLDALKEPPAARGDWGERNFYPWPQVETWKIGDYGTLAK